LFNALSRTGYSFHDTDIDLKFVAAYTTELSRLIEHYAPWYSYFATSFSLNHEPSQMTEAYKFHFAFYIQRQAWR
jgi:hypothetical protein